jgi:AmmeMemoRadiSam system protein A
MLVTGLDESEQAFLLELALKSIIATVYRRPLPRPDLANLPQPLREKRASFVTLTREDRLRGCIGSLEAYVPLAQDVILRASSAAREDPRFPPLEAYELEDLTIEISVLSPPQPLFYEESSTLPTLLQPQVDGVILTYGKMRATFLPQVWERVPDPVQFLGMLCRKAGLPSDAWRALPLQFSTYTVLSFQRTYKAADAGRPAA